MHEKTSLTWFPLHHVGWAEWIRLIMHPVSVPPPYTRPQVPARSSCLCTRQTCQSGFKQGCCCFCCWNGACDQLWSDTVCLACIWPAAQVAWWIDLKACTPWSIICYSRVLVNILRKEHSVRERVKSYVACNSIRADLLCVIQYESCSLAQPPPGNHKMS